MGSLQSKVRISLNKVSKLEQQVQQPEQESKRNFLHGIKEIRGKGMDDIIVETISQNLDTDNAPHDIEKSHRICQLRKAGEKPRPVIVRFFLCNIRNKIFGNKENLKGKKNC